MGEDAEISESMDSSWGAAVAAATAEKKARVLKFMVAVQSMLWVVVSSGWLWVMVIG